MNNATETLQRAQDIFQGLTTEQQLQIKTQEPDTYHALFGGDIIPNTYYLEPFIEKYSDTPIEDKEKLNLSAETKEKDFKNAKFNAVPAEIVKARDLFQKLSVETQKTIKEKKPEIYNVLFKENVFVDQSTLSAFLQEYSSENLAGTSSENSKPNSTIRTFQEFERLDLSAQVEFKQNFPEKYSEILGINK